MSDMDEWDDDEELEGWVSSEEPPDEPANWWDVAVILTGGVAGMFKVGLAVWGDLMNLAKTRSQAHDNKKRFQREALADIEAITGGQDG